MFYLGLTVLSSVLISIFMRLSEKYVQNQMGMFMANYACCIVFSYWFFDTSNIVFDIRTVPLGMIAGSLFLLNFLFLKLNMKYNGMVLSSTFMKLGVMIPTLMAIVVYREVPSSFQVIGILLALVAIVLINFEKEAISEGSKKIWLIFLLLMSGFTDSMANIFEQLNLPTSNDIYLIITFISAFVIVMGISIYKKQKITTKDIFFGILIGIPNYFSVRFLLLALESLDAMIVYPVYSVLTIVILTVFGVLVFKEKISKKKGIALGLILLSLYLLNM